MATLTFSEAVEAFIAASPWLGDEHAPAVASLQALGQALDREITAALVAQYGLTYRALQKAAPLAGGEVDPLEAALGVAGAA